MPIYRHFKPELPKPKPNPLAKNSSPTTASSPFDSFRAKCAIKTEPTATTETFKNKASLKELKNAELDDCEKAQIKNAYDLENDEPMSSDGDDALTDDGFINDEPVEEISDSESDDIKCSKRRLLKRKRNVTEPVREKREKTLGDILNSEDCENMWLMSLKHIQAMTSALENSPLLPATKKTQLQCVQVLLNQISQ